MGHRSQLSVSFYESGMFSDRVLRTSLSSLICLPSQVGVAGQGSEYKRLARVCVQTEVSQCTDMSRKEVVSDGVPVAALT